MLGVGECEEHVVERGLAPLEIDGVDSGRLERAHDVHESRALDDRDRDAETVRVVYDPDQTSPELLLKEFWENHDPTTKNRQGNDVGTVYRSAIYWTTPDQERAAIATRDAFQKVLTDNGFGEITTEIRSAEDAGPFYLAEDYHQGYLDKNPGGYCNHGPNGLTCPVGIVRQDQLPAQQDIAPPQS